MAATLKVITLQNPASPKRNVVFGPKGEIYVDNGFGKPAPGVFCHAFAVFQGTGTVTLLKSGNVSSIADNAVGDYTVNFLTPMPHAFGAVMVTTQPFASGGAQSGSNIFGKVASVARVVENVRVYSEAGNLNAGYDAFRMNVSVFI